MDVYVHYYGFSGPFHPSKPLWLRQADVVLEAPSRAILMGVIRAAATHVGINAPISEVIVTLVWTGANGRVEIVGGRPQPRPESEEDEEEPVPTRLNVTNRIPIHLRVPLGMTYAVQPQQTTPSWLGATYFNGQNYVSQYHHGLGGVPSVMPVNGPLSAVYHQGRNYVGNWYGTGLWPGNQQQQVGLMSGSAFYMADVLAEIVHEAPATEAARPSRRTAATAPAGPVEPARVEVTGEVRRERFTEMRDDGLRRLEATAGMGVLELHVLVDVDGVEWGGAIPPVMAMQEVAMGDEPGDGDAASRQGMRESEAEVSARAEGPAGDDEQRSKRGGGENGV